MLHTLVGMGSAALATAGLTQVRWPQFPTRAQWSINCFFKVWNACIQLTDCVRKRHSSWLLASLQTDSKLLNPFTTSHFVQSSTYRCDNRCSPLHCHSCMPYGRKQNDNLKSFRLLFSHPSMEEFASKMQWSKSRFIIGLEILWLTGVFWNSLVRGCILNLYSLWVCSETLHLVGSETLWFVDVLKLLGL